MDGEYNCIMTAYGYNWSRGFFQEYQQGSRRWRSYRDGIEILTDGSVSADTDSLRQSGDVVMPPIRLPQPGFPTVDDDGSHR